MPNAKLCIPRVAVIVRDDFVYETVLRSVMFAKFVSAAWGDDTGKEADAEGADDQVRVPHEGVTGPWQKLQVSDVLRLTCRLQVSAATGIAYDSPADLVAQCFTVLNVRAMCSSGKQPAASKTLTVAVPSVWGVAASLADTVKRNTAEITAGLKETNWRAEIEAFGKGVREEEQVLRHETAKRVEVAKEHFPKDVRSTIHQVPSTVKVCFPSLSGLSAIILL